MATCALSLIIKRQSYPEPVLLVSASLHKQPLNTFAGLFLLLKQEQQAEVEEKVDFMNFKHVFSLSYIFFGKYLSFKLINGSLLCRIQMSETGSHTPRHCV